jgi:hypothetical protein
VSGRLEALRDERDWRRDRVIALARERAALPRWRLWRRSVLGEAIVSLAYEADILDAQIEVAEIAAEVAKDRPFC